MNQNWDYNYDGGGATYSSPDIPGHTNQNGGWLNETYI